MSPATHVAEVAAALESSPPDALLRALAESLARLWQATGVALWLPDYHQMTLHPVGDPDVSARVDDSWEGRVYAGQRQDVRTAGASGEVELGIPVTIRGDRLGLLVVRLVSGPSQELLADLEVVAGMVGRALLVAGRSTDAYERVRRSRPFTVAAEMQWALLPGVSFSAPGTAVSGQLEPAYSIAGDAYDWSLDGPRLTIVAADGSGRGVSAALASSLALAALRNARCSGLPLSGQAALADQALYSHYAGDQFVSALLLELDIATGRLGIVDAGSPQLWLMRGTALNQIQLEAQLPLGMFDETTYDEQWVVLEPGDRVLVVSDGIHAAGGEELFPIEQVLRSTRLLRPDEVVRHVIRELVGHVPNGELEDDGVILCLDWEGPNLR